MDIVGIIKALSGNFLGFLAFVIFILIQYFFMKVFRQVNENNIRFVKEITTKLGTIAVTLGKVSTNLDHHSEEHRIIMDKLDKLGNITFELKGMKK